VTELTRRQQVDDPLLQVLELDVVARGDNAALVEATVELDNDLAVTVIIDLFELADVACCARPVSGGCCEDLNVSLHRRKTRDGRRV
jgi:hypothetical protein